MNIPDEPVVAVSNTVDILVPDSEDATEATVLEWMKNEGDTVEEHEPLLELSTDKVTMEVAAPASGVLAEVLCRADEVVHPGSVLGRIAVSTASEPAAEQTPPPGQSHEAPVPPPPSTLHPPPSTLPVPPSTSHDPEIDWTDPNPEEFAGFRLSPLVRRMLREHNLSPEDLRGSGRDGRITHRDVLEQVSGVSMYTPGEEDDPEHDNEAAPDAREGDWGLGVRVGAPAGTRQPYSGHVREGGLAPSSSRHIPEETLRIPHSPMRRAIATHMVDSMLRTAPHVTSVFDADLTAVLRHKEEYRDAGDRPTGRPPRLTLTAYFVKAAAVAAQVVPQINSRWHDDALEILPSVDIGVATALGDEGLIVPIVRRAHELDLEEIAAALEELTAHARAGTLAREDVIGGTLTITNHGVSGSLMATPIINQPQSAIVGIGRLEKRVKVVTVDGQDSIQIRPMVYVTLTIDHRALDGYQANRYLSAFVETLEEWD